jgi:hypothetical protein
VGGVFAVGLFPGNAVAQQGRDFLFGAPDVTLGVHAGWASPRAGGDIFDFTREQLTVGKGDFASASWGLHLGVRATERLEVAVDMTFADAEARSELRNWEEEDGRPIEQTTRLRRRPLSVSLKGYLMDRGRSISRFAWIPAPVAPYVGAGAGIMWHSFEQSGDFVDDLDPEDAFIYSDIYRSSGTSPTAHVLAGLDVSVGPRFVLTAEGRYLWASDEMGRDFVDFDDIDLAGFQATAGISVRF